MLVTDPKMLAGARRLRQRSIRSLATAIGVSESYLRRLETGEKTGLRPEAALLLCQELGVEQVDLLFVPKPSRQSGRVRRLAAR